MALTIPKAGMPNWPCAVWKMGEAHPYPDHIIVNNSRPTGNKILHINDLLAIHNEWCLRGLPVANKVPKNISLDIESGGHICSLPFDLRDIHSSGKQVLEQRTENPLKGRLAPVYFFMELHAALLSRSLSVCAFIAERGFNGYRVPHAIRKFLDQMDPQIKLAFEYGNFADWYNIMIVFALLQIAKYSGKTDELTGVLGLVRLTEQVGTPTTTTAMNSVSALGMKEELGYSGLGCFSIVYMKEFLANIQGLVTISGVLEKIRNKIAIDSLLEYCHGRSREELEKKLPEILSAGKLPKVSALISAQPLDRIAAVKERWDIIKRWDIIRSLKDIPSALLEFARNKKIDISDIEDQLIGRSIREAWKLVKALAVNKPSIPPAAVPPAEERPKVAAPPEDPRLKIIRELLKNNQNNYYGDINQPKLAKDSGFADLDEFYEFLKRFSLAKRLHYTRVPIHQLDNVADFWPQLIIWARETEYPIAKLDKLFNGLTKAQCRDKFSKLQKELQLKNAEILAKKAMSAKARARAIAQEIMQIAEEAKKASAIEAAKKKRLEEIEKAKAERQAIKLERINMRGQQQLTEEGARKGSAEDYYYEKKRWYRENKIELTETLPEFQAIWEGKTPEEWKAGFEQRKKEELAIKNKRLPGK